jgi:hypothetical protein
MNVYYDMSDFAGQSVDIRIDIIANNWNYDYAFFDEITLVSVSELVQPQDIVGRCTWFNGAEVVCHPDGRAVAPHIQGRWRVK